MILARVTEIHPQDDYTRSGEVKVGDIIDASLLRQHDGGIAEGWWFGDFDVVDKPERFSEYFYAAKFELLEAK